MFKPEYILDNVALFGMDETIGLIAKKFQRMGKGKAISVRMAQLLVASVVWVAEY